MKLKFNNIRDLADARYAAAAMAEWMGFSVGAVDSLPIGKIQEIIGWCAGPKLVLEVDPSVDIVVVQSYLTVLPVDAVETTVAHFANLNTLPEMEGVTSIILTDSGNVDLSHSSNPGNGTHIENISLKLENANEIVEANPYAISIDCREAENPALKNFDDWNDFFEVLGVF
ncbi:MAG: hypothetical protein IT244_07225 [Bacteroidia bacterium]|nr:hypothetical protein [Bacteroidia bacterium]